MNKSKFFFFNEKQDNSCLKLISLYKIDTYMHLRNENLKNLNSILYKNL